MQTQRLKDTLITAQTWNIYFPLTTCSLMLNDANTHEFRLSLVRHNTRITDQSYNWNVLLFKEAYHIKEKCPILSNGVKVSREIQLF